jgi:GDP/UDP-N,N'-diacetylbacillosamine 2-epimerase (hydrolysing)
VISCDLDSNSILEAIDIAYSKKFEKRLKRTVNPYGNGGASRRIYDVIKDYNLTNIVMKPFNDL